MARKELKAIPVMVHLEASLHELLVHTVNDKDDTMSTYFRELLIKELVSQGRLTNNDSMRLLGVRA